MLKSSTIPPCKIPRFQILNLKSISIQPLAYCLSFSIPITISLDSFPKYCLPLKSFPSNSKIKTFPPSVSHTAQSSLHPFTHLSLSLPLLLSAQFSCYRCSLRPRSRPMFRPSGKSHQAVGLLYGRTRSPGTSYARVEPPLREEHARILLLDPCAVKRSPRWSVFAASTLLRRPLDPPSTAPTHPSYCRGLIFLTTPSRRAIPSLMPGDATASSLPRVQTPVLHRSIHRLHHRSHPRHCIRLRSVHARAS